MWQLKLKENGPVQKRKLTVISVINVAAYHSTMIEHHQRKRMAYNAWRKISENGGSNGAASA